MFITVFNLIWFFLPAGISNLVPVVAAKLPIIKHYNTPIDGGLKFRGKPLFGAHKTIRGFITGISVAIFIAYLQQFLHLNIQSLRELLNPNLLNLNPLIIGFLLGAGALIGDAVESMFKRQINIQPGKAWIPFDQTDYILGGIALTYFYYPLPIIQYLILIVLYFTLHVSISYIGYLIKFKPDPI